MVSYPVLNPSSVYGVEVAVGSSGTGVGEAGAAVEVGVEVTERSGVAVDSGVEVGAWVGVDG
ncbi:MAG: hypothetical protein EHM33_28425 [Chloroflexi bacterium]|nr:MAG: hypothetical protein EHM33_28425 [Chloroflexota bacterium]